MGISPLTDAGGETRREGTGRREELSKVGVEKSSRAVVCPKPYQLIRSALFPLTLSARSSPSTVSVMDITDFIFSQREDTLVVGDYNAYRAHASRKLLKFRKKLGQTTPKGRKYTSKPPVSAENVASNVTYVLCLWLLFYLVDPNHADRLNPKICVPSAPERRTGLGSSNAYEIHPLSRPIGERDLRIR